MTGRNRKTDWRVRAVLAVSVALAQSWGPSASANDPAANKDRVPTIVVTAKRRHFDPVEDAATTVRVQTALHEDPYVLDDHLTVTTVDGVVYLEGFVFDDWDLSRVLRMARRLAGGRRVVNRLEFVSGGSD